MINKLMLYNFKPTQMVLNKKQTITKVDENVKN